MTASVQRFSSLLLLLAVFVSWAPSEARAQETSDDVPASWRTATMTDDDEEAPEWRAAIADSMRLLAMQHALRVTFQGKTRAELGGPFFKDYHRSLKIPKTWSDGDGWLVNHVGHPIQGAASGFIWVANDARSRREEFGFNRRYWKTRGRALAWSTGYSLQFELGPFSEASIGNVGLNSATIGWTDHVVTPIGGTALLIAEDAVDRFLVQWIERRTKKTALRALSRMILNPSRSVANVAQGATPWHRAGRPVVQRH